MAFLASASPDIIKSYFLLTASSKFLAPSTWSWFRAFCSANISAISPRLIPIALAIDSCSIRFILLNLAAVIPCFWISLAIPTKSPSRAICLAFSKLRSLPSKSSASNSLAMDCSKSNKLPAIESILSRLNPIFLASNAALAKLNPCASKENLTAFEVWLISFNIPL